MEIICNRCQQTLPEGSSFCPVCGLPQLVYSAEGDAAQGQTVEPWTGGVRDAATVDWKPALRTALLLAVPAGLLSSMFSPLSILGMPLMAVTAAGVVMLYMRKQHPAWLTLGAGARIGLVTGLVGGWIAAATTACTLFVMRFWLHQGKFYDDLWQNLINQQLTQQWQSMGVDAQSIAAMKQFLLPPEGRAGWILAAISVLAAGLLLFAVAGGALGARLLARSRRPEV
jgi:hypothetical protein